MIGQRIGPYEVVAKLGEGGMGEVFRARDLTLKRDVALKVLPEAVAGDAERLARFRREAEVLASLNHPHIAQIYAVVDRAIVMELVEGEDLAQRIARGPLAVDDAVRIARNIVDALDAAHEAGVIHRDLKPANIRLRANGDAKVLDFGLAKSRIPQAELASLTTITSPDVTSQGVILGTTAFMAPEQATGRPVDRRVDIWAFGCVLFEMLTGKRAFSGATSSETIAAVLKEPPPFGLLPADTPPAIVRLLRHCLEKDPVRRLRDIADARYELEQALAGSPSRDAVTLLAPAKSLKSSWIARLGWTSAGAVIGTLAAAAFMRGDEVSLAPSAVMRMTLTPAADAPLVSGSIAPTLTLSADGRRLIYLSRRTDAEGSRTTSSQLVARSFSDFDGAPIANAGLYPTAAFVSPDRAWIAFATATGGKLTPILAKVPTAGGSMLTICELGSVGNPYGAAWGTDDRIVFATDQETTGLLQVDGGGGTPKPLTIPNRERGERDHLWPEILPGNAGVLFTIARVDATVDIAVLPAGAATWRTLVQGASSARYLPSGHLLYVSGGTLYGVGFDVQRLEITTERVPLVEKIAVKSSGIAEFAVSNGTLAYLPARQDRATTRLVWLNRDGTVVALPLEPGAYVDPVLSPNGERIAVGMRESGVDTIWMYDVSQQAFTRVSSRSESVGTMSWSVDSTRLAFWSETNKGLFMMAPGSSGSPIRLTEIAKGAHYPYGWTPDGTRVSFVQVAESTNLFTVSTTSPRVVRRLGPDEGSNVEASFSPNGKWVAHVAYDGRTPEVVVGPADVPERRWPVAPAGRYPVWGAGGREVLFFDDNAIRRVAVDPATGMPIGAATVVAKTPSGLSRINPTPDGARFLMLEQVRAAGSSSEIRVVLNWSDELKLKMQQAKLISR